MSLVNLLRKIKNRFSTENFSLLRIGINSQNLLHNINQFKNKYPQHKISAVLKSNAYGHGLKEIGLFLDKNKDIQYFVVDSLLEAQILRQAGVKKEVIILSYIVEKSLPLLKKLRNIIVVVNSLRQAEILSEKISFALKIHLKVDTGMHRQGVLSGELEKTILVLQKNSKIKICGLMTHLADASNINETDTLKQLEVWKSAVKTYRRYFLGGDLHFAATAGTRYLDKAESNLIRLGIGMYGFENRQDKILDLKPVLSFWAKIVNIKAVKRGEKIGYDFSFVAENDMKIAILPCGYYEGIPRVFSNQGFVYVNGQPVRLVGRVSMNLSAIDITEVHNKVGLESEVCVISDKSENLNSVLNCVKITGELPYEILIHLAPNIRRIIK